MKSRPPLIREVEVSGRDCILVIRGVQLWYRAVGDGRPDWSRIHLLFTEQLESDLELLVQGRPQPELTDTEKKYAKKRAIGRLIPEFERMECAKAQLILV